MMGSRFSASQRTKRVQSEHNTIDKKNFCKTMDTHEESTTIVNPATTVNSMTTNIKREYHNDKTSTYWLPKDDEEQMRLTGVKTSAFAVMY